MTNAIFLTGPIKTIDSDKISKLCSMARQSSNGRYRYCLHSSTSEPLQNMVIALTNHSKLLPQRRLGAPKTFSIISGRIALVIFNTDGKLVDSIVLDNLSACKLAYFDDSHYVLTQALSEVAIYHEIINGNITNENDYGSWSIDNQEIKRHLTQKHGNL